MEPINAADFHDLVIVEDPAVHPTGDRVAFIRKVPSDAKEYATAIHLADLESGSTQRLTVEKGSDSQPRWHPDGDDLAFVSDRLTDDERPQVWLLPTDGGEARQVTSVAGGVGDLTWSPSGERLLFTQQVTKQDVEEDRDREVPDEFEPEEPDPRVIDRTIYRANERYFDRRRARLYTVSVEDDEVTRLGDWDDIDQMAPTWGDDDTVYLLEKVGDDPDDSDVTELIELDLTTGDRRPVTQIEGFVMGIDATDDGQVIVHYSPTPRPTLRLAELLHIDVETGDQSMLTEGLERTVSGPITIDPAQRFVYFLVPDAGGVTVRRVPIDGGAIETLTDPMAAVSTFDIDGGTLAYVQSECDHPGDLFARDADGSDQVRLTEVNEDVLTERVVGEPEEYWFDGPDGDQIQGWLLTPTDGSDGPFPLVLEIHGGPHGMWTTSGTMWHEFQSIAGAGYAVLWTNPRGSIGYGEAFSSAIADDWGDVTHGDLMAAVDEIVDRSDIDASELFITGGSFGGYQTSWTIGRTDRFKAAVSQRGVYDIPAFFGVTDAYLLIESEFDVAPWTDQQWLYERSPSSLVEEVTTPTLIIHSDDDYRTPASTAEMYFRALRKLEIPTRLVRYPREGHELSRSGEPAHRVDRIERIIRWFDGYADHTDVPPALERPPHEGLSIDASEDED